MLEGSISTSSPEIGAQVGGSLQYGIQGPQGPQGETGVDGITPHIGDNGNWFIGETDTGLPSRGGVEFETDETLTLENGVLSVNTEVINTMTDEEIAALNAHII